MLKKEIHTVMVSGNRRDKFIKWLKNVCPKHRIWRFSDDWQCSNARYNKYYDLVRYPREKFLKVMNKSLPMYIQFEISAELFVMLELCTLESENRPTWMKMNEFFKSTFKANTGTFPRSKKFDQTNLVLGIDTFHFANLPTKTNTTSHLSLILVEDTME